MANGKEPPMGDNPDHHQTRGARNEEKTKETTPHPSHKRNQKKPFGNPFVMNKTVKNSL